MSMIMPDIETQHATQKLRGTHPPQAARRTADAQVRQQPAAAVASELSASARVLRDELDSVRREHAKLQQAVYEAAQIQRRLCAPRELVSGEFEIAGEIFPVRHLSGDFFKVMELDSTLGLTVGDIAGKGLSAGICQAPQPDLIQRRPSARRLPGEAVAGGNADLCRDRNEPPLAGLFFARLD